MIFILLFKILYQINDKDYTQNLILEIFNLNINIILLL
jgi:hypothetical protein